MYKIIAIVAHFDVNDQIDPSFKIILKCLKKICFKVILVTTSTLNHTELPSDIITIQRPNIGYDFYSYKVGIDKLYQLNDYESFLLINSSFLVLNEEKFIHTLLTMAKALQTSDVVSITASTQFSLHFQSYLLLLKTDLLSQKWFKDWQREIEPKNSKMETIFAYEIGLSNKIIISGIKTTVLFKESIEEKSVCLLKWHEWQRKNGEKTINDDYNPVHFSAHLIAEKFGIVKTEFLRNNPHQLDTNWVKNVSSANIWPIITDFIERSKPEYKSSNDGLINLASKDFGIPKLRLVCTAPLARRGVRIGVVIHLYYIELIDDFFNLLKNIIEPFDLFVTTPFEGQVLQILNKFSPIAQSLAVIIIENKGRDIGPFLALYRHKLLDPYRAVLKLHSKQSKYSENGQTWRVKLFNELCGSYQTVQAIMSLFERRTIGILGPHEYYLTNAHFWGGNLLRVHSLLKSVGINLTPEEIPLGFFAGSMFWFNPLALKALHKIPEELFAFEPEDGQRDATLAHAFERIFSNLAQNSGYLSTSLKLMGSNIHEFASETNTVPVLMIPKS